MKKIKKLRVNRESLRVLATGGMGAVHGGGSRNDSCVPYRCPFVTDEPSTEQCATTGPYKSMVGDCLTIDCQPF